MSFFCHRPQVGYFALKSPIMHHFFGGTFLPSQSEPPLFWTDKVQSGDQRASAAFEVILFHPMVESRELGGEKWGNW